MAGDPETIGRYKVVERVGRGGMGVLYRGMDPVLDREVAIKVMLLDFSEDEEQMRPRFYREARAVAKLQHRNIVTIFEFAEEGTTPYIVMEFLRGTSLAARMKSPLPLPLDTKLDIVAQLCAALDYAHQQGVVHRDVKPANVFVLEDGTVKLLDFGIAKVATSTLTRQGDVLGSASYMSPEQVSGENVDGRSDIFSVGVVLYELLSGRKPFHADQPTGIIVKILHQPPYPIEEVVAGLPPALVAAVTKALAKKPEERFATAGEFANELQRIRRTLESSRDSAEGLDETRFASPTEIRTFQRDLDQTGAKTAVTAGAVTEPPAGKKWLMPAIGAAVVVLAIGAFFMFRSSPPMPSDAPTPSAGAPAAAARTPAANGSSRAPAATAPVADKKGTAGGATRVPVQIQSDPSGAAIALDGRDTKLITPAAVSISSDGSHRLRLSKRGFASEDVQLSDADVRSGALSYTLKPEAAAMVPVSITSTYPVTVMSGDKTLAPAGETHQLSLPAGTTIHVTSSEYLLDAAIKVDDKGVDYQAPAVGFLTVVTKFETCHVKIGTKDLGFPPITKLSLAAGQHRVDIACDNGQNPPGQYVTVAPNAIATARIY